MAASQLEVMVPTGAMDEQDPVRRRLNRDYVLTIAPRRLDSTTTPDLVDRLWKLGPHCELIIDVSQVDQCGPDVIDVLDHTAAQLAASDVKVILSHPAPPVDAALASMERPLTLAVRRPTERRPQRRSTRGQL